METIRYCSITYHHCGSDAYEYGKDCEMRVLDFVVLSSIIVGLMLIGAMASLFFYEKQAVKYHHAYYHPQTGEFTWKKWCK